MIVGTAMKRFGSVDALVNNAGIFFAKPFTEYTPEDFRALSPPIWMVLSIRRNWR